MNIMGYCNGGGKKMWNVYTLQLNAQQETGLRQQARNPCKRKHGRFTEIGEERATILWGAGWKCLSPSSIILYWGNQKVVGLWLKPDMNEQQDDPGHGVAADVMWNTYVNEKSYASNTLLQQL